MYNLFYSGKPSTLYGTEFDMKLLKSAFSMLGFDVKEHINKNYDEILKIVSTCK